MKKKRPSKTIVLERKTAPKQMVLVCSVCDTEQTISQGSLLPPILFCRACNGVMVLPIVNPLVIFLREEE